jgi:hypothetical protein
MAAGLAEADEHPEDEQREKTACEPAGRGRQAPYQQRPAQHGDAVVAVGETADRQGQRSIEDGEGKPVQRAQHRIRQA